MLTRLTDYVERGVIDNRQRDIVRLELYFKGSATPLSLELEGNCLKDLAGSLISFEIKPEYEEGLHSSPPCDIGSYEGLVGDITASRKAKLPGKANRLVNCLYIEAFASDLGMILVEGNRYSVNVSPYEWMMDSGEEQTQIMCNQQVLRDYVHDWVKRFSITQEDRPPLPDHRWDIRLREAEAIAIAYQEVHLKFSHAPCGDTSEAFVMGWDDVLGDIADSEENGTSYCCHISGSLCLFDVLEDDEAIEAQLCMSHPLFQQMITITETAQRLFAKQINEMQVNRKAPVEELGILFHAIRYSTPSVLSCLLQMNEEDVNYRVLAERIKRCADYIGKAVDVVLRVRVKGIKEFHDSLALLYDDLLSMRKDLLNQSNL